MVPRIFASAPGGAPLRLSEATEFAQRQVGFCCETGEDRGEGMIPHPSRTHLPALSALSQGLFCRTPPALEHIARLLRGANVSGAPGPPRRPCLEQCAHRRLAPSEIALIPGRRPRRCAPPALPARRHRAFAGIQRSRSLAGTSRTIRPKVPAALRTRAVRRSPGSTDGHRHACGVFVQYRGIPTRPPVQPASSGDCSDCPSAFLA